MHYATLIALVSLLGIISTRLSAQDHNIRFQTGQAPPSTLYEEGVIPESDTSFAQTTFQGNHYLILQFQSIPSPAALQALQDRGVELFDYIPNYAYLASVPVSVSLNTLGIRAAGIYEGRYKLPLSLANGDYPGYAFDNGQLRLLLYPWPSVAPESLRASLEAEGFQPGQPEGLAVPIGIADSMLLELAAHPGIRYVGLPEPPAETEGIIAVAL